MVGLAWSVSTRRVMCSQLRAKGKPSYVHKEWCAGRTPASSWQGRAIHSYRFPLQCSTAACDEFSPRAGGLAEPLPFQNGCLFIRMGLKCSEA
eukprot:1145376-Pelagomonas_calceolata.AAC.3